LIRERSAAFAPLHRTTAKRPAILERFDTSNVEAD